MDKGPGFPREEPHLVSTHTDTQASPFTGCPQGPRWALGHTHMGTVPTSALAGQVGTDMHPESCVCSYTYCGQMCVQTCSVALFTCMQFYVCSHACMHVRLWSHVFRHTYKACTLLMHSHLCAQTYMYVLLSTGMYMPRHIYTVPCCTNVGIIMCTQACVWITHAMHGLSHVQTYTDAWLFVRKSKSGHVCTDVSIMCGGRHVCSRVFQGIA